MRRRNHERVIHDVGRRVADLRAQRGFTQADFAEVLGMNAKHLQRVELGALNLTIKTLVRLADKLDVPIGDLFITPTTRLVKRGRPRKRRVAE